MKSAPLILPWLASRAGVNDELATKLWRRARQEAQTIAGNGTSSDFHALTLDRFINLLEIEAGGEASIDSAPYGWVWRHPQRMARYSFAAGDALTRAWQDLLRKLSEAQTV